MYARIDLSRTNYALLSNVAKMSYPDIDLLQDLYQIYCTYKKFNSVMPIFPSEYTDPNNDVLVYTQHDTVIAFSLLRRYDSDNVEAIQFAWDYADPSLRLGIRSLEHECAYYKSQGYRYLYLGDADEYKTHMQGFELLGPA